MEASEINPRKGLRAKVRAGSILHWMLHRRCPRAAQALQESYFLSQEYLLTNFLTHLMCYHYIGHYH